MMHRFDVSSEVLEPFLLCLSENADQVIRYSMMTRLRTRLAFALLMANRRDFEPDRLLTALRKLVTLPTEVRCRTYGEPLLFFAVEEIIGALDREDEVTLDRAGRIVELIVLDGVFRARPGACKRHCMTTVASVVELIGARWNVGNDDGQKVVCVSPSLVTIDGREGRVVIAPEPLEADLVGGVKLRNSRCYADIGFEVLRKYGADSGDSVFACADGLLVRRSFHNALSVLQQLWEECYRSICSQARIVIPMASSTTISGFTVDGLRGAVFVALQDDAIGTAEGIVHEAAHNRLNSANELWNIWDDDGAAHFSSPWRDDLRTLGGVIHGIYAYSQVATIQRCVVGPQGA